MNFSSTHQLFMNIFLFKNCIKYFLILMDRSQVTSHSKGGLEGVLKFWDTLLNCCYLYENFVPPFGDLKNVFLAWRNLRTIPRRYIYIYIMSSLYTNLPQNLILIWHIDSKNDFTKRKLQYYKLHQSNPFPPPIHHQKTI